MKASYEAAQASGSDLFDDMITSVLDGIAGRSRELAKLGLVPVGFRKI